MLIVVIMCAYINVLVFGDLVGTGRCKLALNCVADKPALKIWVENTDPVQCPLLRGAADRTGTEREVQVGATASCF
jgi:hypothetical protein